MVIAEPERRDRIRPIYTQRDLSDRAYVRDIAHTKRFLERWVGDAAFREALPRDPQGVTQQYNLAADPAEIRLLWDEAAAQAHPPDAPVPLVVQRYRAFIQEKFLQRHHLLAEGCVPTHAAFRTWRQRQLARTRSQLGPQVAENLIHAPICFELSQGCSVGCWFCGLAAPKLTDVCQHTPTQAALWRDLLAVAGDVIGPAAGRGFCYWATDPLDNPDYADFLADFHDVLGHFPQTTTAQGHKYPDRVRALLQQSEAVKGILNRFSVLSLAQLNQIHATYSAEELLFVELILQNPESTYGKHVAGRVRQRQRRQAEAHQQPYPDDAVSGTIACVSGFLVNLVTRQVKLISPCNASDRWPLGYRVYQQGTFTDAASFRALLTDMIRQQMGPVVRTDDPVAWRADLVPDIATDRVQLSSAFLRHTLTDQPGLRLQTTAATLTQMDAPTAGAIALRLEQAHQIPLPETFHALNALRQLGLLDDEPQPV